MALGKPDPRYTQGKKAQANFRLALKVAFLFLAALWLVFLLDAFLGLKLNRFGLRPGSVPGLIGVVTAPLCHTFFPTAYPWSSP
jgi:nucleoside permease NupC